MSGYHALAVRGELDAADVIRRVYGLGADDTIEPAGTGEFPGHFADPESAIAARVAGWTVVCGDYPPDMLDDGETARLAELSRGRKVVRWATQSVTGAVGLDVFDDGAHRRSFWQMEGEVERDLGEPLPGEPAGGFQALDPFDRDEWKIVEAVQRQAASWDEMAEPEYTRFDFRQQRGGPSDEPQPAGPWWKLW